MKIKLSEKEKLANGLVLQMLEQIENTTDETGLKDTKKNAIEVFVFSAYAVAKNDYHPRMAFKRLADEILLNILPVIYHFTVDEADERMSAISKSVEESIKKAVEEQTENDEKEKKISE